MHFLANNLEHCFNTSLRFFCFWKFKKQLIMQMSKSEFPKDRSADHLWSIKILKLILGSKTFNICQNMVIYWAKLTKKGPPNNFMVHGKNFRHLWSRLLNFCYYLICFTCSRRAGFQFVWNYGEHDQISNINVWLMIYYVCSWALCSSLYVLVIIQTLII